MKNSGSKRRSELFDRILNKPVNEGGTLSRNRKPSPFTRIVRGEEDVKRLRRDFEEARNKMR